ncbi:MAG: hypothetical protein IE918_05995 [Campylobacterales bacterium]|nr:hypothetical protein [Campylobacterales bacterium]
MKQATIFWFIIIFLPVLLWLSMFVLGLIGLALYWGYYMPLWSLGEPFFNIQVIQVGITPHFMVT